MSAKPVTQQQMQAAVDAYERAGRNAAAAADALGIARATYQNRLRRARQAGVEPSPGAKPPAEKPREAEKRQQAQEALDAVTLHGNITQAAIALGVTRNTVREREATAKRLQLDPSPAIQAHVAAKEAEAKEQAEARRLAMQGYSPAHDMTRMVPSPYVVKGVSTYYDKEGKPTGQWVKSRLDNDAAEQAIREFVAHLVKDARGIAKPVPAPKVAMSDLLAVYPMGDPHFGMYAWKDESGDDFDLGIAERITRAAVDRLVASAPPAETALFLELGDFFHADSTKNATPQSGNVLDVDTRWGKVVQVGLRTMKYCVQRMLEKHQRVVARFVRGNHDPHSSFMLALAVAEFFANEPRVQVELSPSPFWYFAFGRVLIGVTHGDTTKMDALPGIMAADRPDEWGAAKHRYWYQGHIHVEDRKEFRGVSVEAFRTLAAKDAWTAGAGYRAGRDMRLIVHHREHGEIERHRCDIGMLDAAKKETLA